MKNTNTTHKNKKALLPELEIKNAVQIKATVTNAPSNVALFHEGCCGGQGGHTCCGKHHKK